MTDETLSVEPRGAGFALRGSAGETFAATAAGPAVWEVVGGGAPRTLTRVRPGRFVLAGAEGLPPATATPLDPFGFPGNLYYLLSGDGRLFRVQREGPRSPGFRLCGWETEGPYLVAVPEGEGWRVEATPAGRGIDATRDLTILFVALILAEDEASGFSRQGPHGATRP